MNSQVIVKDPEVEAREAASSGYGKDSLVGICAPPGGTCLGGPQTGPLVATSADLTATAADPIKAIIRAVLDDKLPIEKMAVLVELWDKMQAEHARTEFLRAHAKFLGEVQEIKPDKHVHYNQVDYWYATFARMVSTIGPCLAANGISFSFPTSVDGGAVFVSCRLSHIGGHTEESTKLEAEIAGNGKMTKVQQLSCAITSLKRFAFILATGVSVKNDGESEVSEAAYSSQHQPQRPAGPAQKSPVPVDLFAGGIKRLQEDGPQVLGSILTYITKRHSITEQQTQELKQAAANAAKAGQNE